MSTACVTVTMEGQERLRAGSRDNDERLARSKAIHALDNLVRVDQNLESARS